MSQDHSPLKTSQSDNPIESTLDERDIRAAASMLIQRYGIDSAFVRVGTIAKILGLSPAAVYTAMREGRFFMPHRLLSSAPVVKLDDLARWYCAPDTAAVGCASRRVAPGDGKPTVEEPDIVERLRDMRQAEADTIVEQALASLGFGSSHPTRIKKRVSQRKCGA